MMTSLARVEIRYEQDVVHARQRARLIAEQFEAPLSDDANALRQPMLMPTEN